MRDRGVANFIWSIADEVLRDDFKRGRYPDVNRWFFDQAEHKALSAQLATTTKVRDSPWRHPDVTRQRPGLLGSTALARTIRPRLPSATSSNASCICSVHGWLASSMNVLP